MLEKYLGNSFLMYMLAEILQFVHEANSFCEVFYKKSILKNFSKFTGKLKKKSFGGVLSRRFS